MNIGDVHGVDLLLLVLHLLSEALLVGEGVRQSVAVTHLAKPGVVVVVMMVVVLMVMPVLVMIEVVLVETMIIWQRSSKVLGWKSSRFFSSFDTYVTAAAVETLGRLGWPGLRLG